MLPSLGVAAVAVALCSAARCGDARFRPSEARDLGPPLDGLVGLRSPDRLVAEVARLLQADDAALFGWDLGSDGLRLLAASRPGLAAGVAGRHLAREAVVAGRLSVAPPVLVPADGGLHVSTALAVPAARAEVRLGALCVSRSGPRPFTSRERALLLRLGVLAADVLSDGARAGDARGQVGGVIA